MASQGTPRQSERQSSQMRPPERRESQPRHHEKKESGFLPTRVDPEQRELLQGLQEHKKLLKNCSSAILVLGQDKKTIKKPDLSRLIYTGTRKQHHTVTKAVLAQANHDLNKYMGMRLYDIGDDKGYLLVNSTSLPNQCRKEHSQENCNELAVMFLVLMEIFSSADEASTESQIMKVLDGLELPHEDLKDCFNMLLKRLYIVQDKDRYQNDESLYRWGPRAVAEVDPDKFMESFLDFAEGGSDNDWPDQKRRIDLLKQVPNRRLPTNQA